MGGMFSVVIFNHKKTANSSHIKIAHQQHCKELEANLQSESFDWRHDPDS